MEAYMRYSLSSRQDFVDGSRWQCFQ